MAHTGRSEPWWQAIDRRHFGKGALAFTTLLSMSGCKGEEQVNAESLALQKKHGWNVGAESERLFFMGAQRKDSLGSTTWTRYKDPTRLLNAWRPKTELAQPFFIPTLIQALQSNTLREQIRPISTHAMQDAFGRGETLRKDLLSQTSNPEETFFIADLPGPESVAFGAGMGGGVDVALGFDNWPHPLGVVRSHETLAALIYYAARMEEEKKKLPPSAPAMLLLDNQRLAPYKDEDGLFDNRYLATVPLVPALRKRGVKHVMYVVENRKQKNENDDLNDEFVEYNDAGIQVAILPLSDLKAVTETVARKASDGTTKTVRERHYYYGGGYGTHLGFFHYYPFFYPYPTAYYHPAGGRRMTYRESSRPRTPAPNYQPRSRPTRFSGSRVGGKAGVGRSKPSGFGRTTVRSSGGRITGMGSRVASRSSGRSGSLGRGGFFSGG
jgi:hypothetical protein